MNIDLKFNKNIKVGDYTISENDPVFIIAEAGVNHNGDMNLAKKLIDLAVEAGANAVKFQTFRADQLILKSVVKAPYQQKTTDSSETQYEMLKRLEVSRIQNIELCNYSKNRNIVFLTTPFDEASLDEIDELDLPAYKIASTDTTNLPFLEKVAKIGKPIFLSTGMSYLSEVQMALETIYENNKDAVLLQCTANYPIRDNEANLAVLETYKSIYDIIIGYSDHTVGIGAAVFAIPMGAKVLEKHFTLDRTYSGPDQKASLTPDELKEFVRTVRKVELYMGDSIKRPNLSEIRTRASLQKCLVANTKIKKGELFTRDNINAKRTGGIGISPIYYKDILGTRSNKNYSLDEIIEI